MEKVWPSPFQRSSMVWKRDMGSTFSASEARLRISSGSKPNCSVRARTTSSSSRNSSRLSMGTRVNVVIMLNSVVGYWC